jgi:hypothetical protein
MFESLPLGWTDEDDEMMSTYVQNNFYQGIK